METQPSIWILEDDQKTVQLYQDIFDARYVMRFFARMDVFASEISTASDKPDLVIADIKLSDGSFLDYIANFRPCMGDGPEYLVVSGIDDMDALQFCFDNGVVEYLTKPFRTGELTVKVSRILGSIRTRQCEFELDHNSLTVTRRKLRSPILTSKEFLIVNFLRKAPDNRMTRDQLMQAVWPNKQISVKTMDVHMFNLRKKLQAVHLEVKFSNPNIYSINAAAINESE